jgi:FixJ family two-component response regulator
MATERVTRNRGISRTEVERRIGSALTKAIPPYVTPAKVVAVDLGISPRTVENLRANIPEAMVTMGMIGCVSPVFALQMCELWGIDIDTSRGYALYLELQRQMLERLK